MIGLNSEYQNNKLSFKFSPTFLQMAGENLEFNANLNFEDEVFGNIKFNYESENSGGNANLNIDIKDDKIINYNTVGNLENLYEKITWEGEGNQDSGSFELVSKFQNEIVGNILYKYDDNKYDLNFDTEEVKIIGKLEKENEMYNFDLNFQLNNGNEFDISSKIKFIDNKIDYFSLDLITNIPIKFTGLDIISNNKYKILYENNYLDSTFNYYEINSGEEKHILSSSLSGDLSYNNTDLNLSIEPIEEIGDSFIKGNLNHNNDYLKISGNLKEYDDLYYLDIEGDFSAWENIDLQGSAGTENTDKEEIINLDKMFSYKDNEIKSKFNINSMGEEMFSYNLNINYEIDNFEHIIPSNYVQAKDNEFFQLPNFSSYNDIETPYLIAGGIVGLGMFLSTSVPDRTYAQAQSRDAARFANIGQIGTALSIYHYDRGIYPESDGIIEVSEIQDYLIPRYMDSLPNDPLDGKNYYYISLNSDGEENKGYALIAELESNDGNISANSIDEVYNMIKGVNYDSKNLKEILQDFGNYYLMVK
ncbi:hypothetical protein VAMP_106108n207 [Candidatus Vampirococcus lugosii]|uniref:Uncharacterized protein n=2 Tax=Candidatus Vampirococcus lugosii TaxID=2789015 RepID=A0ABS5QQJ7_9BACT|nr:hypothetical protein [Candidatus Vampirococcus lugosii]